MAAVDAQALAAPREASAAFGIAVAASVVLHLGAIALVAPLAFRALPPLFASELPMRLDVVLVEAPTPVPAVGPGAAIPPVSAGASSARGERRQPALTARSAAATDTTREAAERRTPRVPEAPLHVEAVMPVLTAPAASEAQLAALSPTAQDSAPAPAAAATPAAPTSPTASGTSSSTTRTSSATTESAASVASASRPPPNSGPASTPVTYLDAPPPAYPESARRDGQQGLTVVEVLVSKAGVPLDVRVVKTSGIEVLDGAAAAGVRQWRFSPAMRDREPIDARITIPIRFRLDGNG
jgi:protein TonB